MKFALTTATGVNQATTLQLEKAAAEILYDFRHSPIAIAATALLEKMNEYCDYWMPWLVVSVDRITPDFTIYLNVKYK